MQHILSILERLRRRLRVVDRVSALLSTASIGSGSVLGARVLPARAAGGAIGTAAVAPIGFARASPAVSVTTTIVTIEVPAIDSTVATRRTGVISEAAPTLRVRPLATAASIFARIVVAGTVARLPLTIARLRCAAVPGLPVWSTTALTATAGSAILVFAHPVVES